MEGNLHVKIDWASLIVGRKFCILGQFPSPPGGLYLEGRFNRGVFALQVWARGLYLEGLYMEGLIFGVLRYVLCCGLNFSVRTHKCRCQQNLTQLRLAVAHSE